MSRPSLDDIELDIVKPRMDLNLHKYRNTHPDDPKRLEYARQIELDQRRYKQLTGRWYTFRHADDARGEE